VKAQWIANKNVWRIFSILLLAVGLSGPWVYDRIHVPSPFECQAPYIRLTDDFCGEPVSPISFVIEQIQYSPGIASLFPFMLLQLAFTLPIISTVIMILLKDFKPWKIVHIVVLTLLAVYSIIYVYAAVGSLAQAALWGVWLYLITLILLLVFEIVTMVSRSGSAPAAQISG
jgi:hypothetical protein